MTLWIKNKGLVFFFLVCFLSGCGIYSFSSARLSEDLKSITIQNFTMGTAGGPQNLSLDFNERLKEYYQRNTSLKILPVDGDLYLAGSITGYELTPVSTTASDRAAQNRLTIKVDVQFRNNKYPEENFEREFSFFQDFSQELTLTDIEPSLVPKILDQLVLNIFNETAAKW